MYGSTPREVCNNQTIYEEFRAPDPPPPQNSELETYFLPFIQTCTALQMNFVQLNFEIITAVIGMVVFMVLIIRSHKMQKDLGKKEGLMYLSYAFLFL